MEGIEKYICPVCVYTIPCNKRIITIKEEKYCTTYKCLNYVKCKKKLKKYLIENGII